MVHTLLQEIRVAFRTLTRTPVFTAVAILSLALGIGANTAIFSLMDQVLLRLLPVKNPRELVLLDAPGPNSGLVMAAHAFSYPMYTDIRDRAGVFAGVLARFPVSFAVSNKGQTGRVDGELVSGNYFEVLGVRPAIGRLFSMDDDRKVGGHPVVVLSHGYWQRRFGGSTSVLGSVIDVNGSPVTVIGVAAASFLGTEVGRPCDMYLPMMMKKIATPTWDEMFNRRAMWLELIGRLAPGMTPEKAAAGATVVFQQALQEELKDMPSVTGRFRDQFPNKKIVLVRAQSGRSDFQKDAALPLIVLMSMVGLVLLIACANVANLLIARAASRQKEIAIRLALGGSRLQVIRQLLIESLLLSLAGGLAGVLVAMWTGESLIQLLPFETATRAFNARPDGRVLVFNFVLACLTGIAFGLIPALRSTKPQLAPTLKDEAGNLSANVSGVRLRKGLVAAQVAFSLLLLVGAGLFARSLYNLKSMSPGFSTENLVQFSVEPTLVGYNQQRAQQFFRQLRENLAGLPGVRGVSLAEEKVLSGDQAMMTVNVEGYTAKEGENMNPVVNAVSPGHFRTLGIPLIAGRDFNERDVLGAPKVAVVNEAFASYFFKGQNPIGKRYGSKRQDTPDIEIVGVVRDGRTANLREEVKRAAYTPYMQDDAVSEVTAYIRTVGDPAQVEGMLQREVQKLDPHLPVYGIKTVDAQLDELLFAERLIAMLSMFFGGLATLLAAIGLYGVMAFTVARRTREIGIRMALGAEQSGVVRLVLQEVMWMTGIGICIGLPLSLALGRLVESQLFGVHSWDPLTMTGATLILLLTSLAAGAVPATRATRIDPMVALRYE